MLTDIHAQTGWDLLAQTEIQKATDPFMGDNMDLPLYPDAVKDAEGSIITLEGFVIPLQQDADQYYFVLSRYPYQSCFFCGAAGPETVVEVYSNKKFRYTDERVRVTGKLLLNHNDPIHLFFMMKDCEVVKL